MAQPRVQNTNPGDLHPEIERLTELASTGLDPSERDDFQRLVHKFRIYQTDLEQRNEALLKKCDEIESARRRYEFLYRKYSNLFSFSSTGHLIVDRDGFVQEINLAAATALKTSRRTLLGRRITDFIHHEDQAAFYYNKLNCQQNPSGSIFELKMRTMDGVYFDACLHMQSLLGTPLEDRTFSLELKETGARRHLSASLSLIQNCLETSLKAADLDSLLNGCLQLVKAYLQCDAVGIYWREAPGAPVHLVQAGIPRACLETERLRSAVGGLSIEKVMFKRSGGSRNPFFTRKGSFYINAASRFPFEPSSGDLASAAIACCDQGYESFAFVPIAVDDIFYGFIHAVDRRANRFPLRVIEAVEMVADRMGLATQRLLLRQELKSSLNQLDALSSHLLTVQEEEQQRIAMELHDGCGQDMIGLKLALQGVRAMLPADGKELPAACDRLLVHCDKIIGELREIAYGLRPMHLKTLGLAGATRQLIREFANTSGIAVESDIALLEQIDDSKAQIALFRIFQEAFSNIHKHAQATRVDMRVSRQEKQLQILIQDNGIGFDAQQRPEGGESRHGMGLPAMALRCRMIGAALSIDSEPGKGVRTIIRIPLTKGTAGS
jgi:signal transduction histidine kinase/PAS domain-containing protein